MKKRALQNDGGRKIVLGVLDLRESEVQDEGVKFLRRIGCKVYVTSQRRASSVTKGVPDVLVFPANGRPFFFWEAKSETGKLSPEQQEFGALCRESGTGWCYGTVAALMDHLKKIGVL